MARRRTIQPKHTEPPLTLGFFGGAEYDPKTFLPLLDDLVTGREVNMIFVPVSPEDYLSEIRQVVAWAEKHEYPLSTISTENPSPDPVCQTVLDHDYDDYDAGEDTPKALIELLMNQDDTDGALKVEDGRLLVFYADKDGNVEDRTMDAALTAVEKGLPTYDLTNGLDLMTAEEDGDLEDAEALGEPDEEPTPRRGRKAPAPQTDTSSGDIPPREELSTWTTVELKKLAKEVDPERCTTETLRGKDKDYVIDAILHADPDDLAGDRPTDEGGPELTEFETAMLDTPEVMERQERKLHPVDPPGHGGDDEGMVTDEPTEPVVEESDEAQQSPVTRSRAAMKEASAPMVSKALADDPDKEEFQELIQLITEAFRPLVDYAIEEMRKPKPRGRPAKTGE